MTELFTAILKKKSSRSISSHLSGIFGSTKGMRYLNKFVKHLVLLSTWTKIHISEVEEHKGRVQCLFHQKLFKRGKKKMNSIYCEYFIFKLQLGLELDF